MKPFDFRLERVLQYRKHLEKKAQAGLIKVKNEYSDFKGLGVGDGLEEFNVDVIIPVPDDGM